jgi:sugar lactone lactonase YvrE
MLVRGPALCLLAAFLFAAADKMALGRDKDQPPLEVLFELPLAPAGMTVTPDGSFVISISHLERPQNRVLEINKKGGTKPFPTTAISQAAPGEPLTLDAVQGMQVDQDGIVWMLDNGRLSETPPKIVGWDVPHNKLHRILNLPSPSVLPSSNLGDIAVESAHPFIYVTDPAAGVNAALIVVDSSTGLTRRVLQGHPSVVPVEGLDLVIDGQKIQTKRLDGSVADPLGGVRSVALDKHGEWLYFGPMRSLKLYRIKTEHLRNAELSPEKLADLVEEYSSKPLSSGISIDSKNNIYVADLAGKAIGMIAANNRQYHVLVSDPRCIWPDGLCFGTDGKLYFFNNIRFVHPRGAPQSGADAPTNYLFRVQTPASGRPGE